VTCSILHGLASATKIINFHLKILVYNLFFLTQLYKLLICLFQWRVLGWSNKPRVLWETQFCSGIFVDGPKTMKSVDGCPKNAPTRTKNQILIWKLALLNFRGTKLFDTKFCSLKAFIGSLPQ